MLDLWDEEFEADYGSIAQCDDLTSDGGSGPYPSVAQRMPGKSGSFRHDAASMPLVHVSDDFRECHFIATPVMLTNKHKQLFTAVTFRHIDFDDTSVMFGWCHEGCGNPNDIGGMVSSASKLHGPSTAWEGPRLCQCAQQLLSHIGGEMALESLMRSRHPSERSSHRTVTSCSTGN
jgi:hypothetical protein